MKTSQHTLHLPAGKREGKDRTIAAPTANPTSDRGQPPTALPGLTAFGEAAKAIFVRANGLPAYHRSIGNVRITNR